jgi:hypothetical protein
MTGLTPPATPRLPTLTIVGVESSGAEQEIDYSVWKPPSLKELDSQLACFLSTRSDSPQSRWKLSP